jgi:hypothetical protein
MKSIIYVFIFVFLIAILPIERVKATSAVHFYCSTENRGNGGAINFAGTVYYSGQSASYSEGDYAIAAVFANLPSPTSDWHFYRWSVMWIGTMSWVDNENSQSTIFHLRGEAYLWIDFYSPIQANSPLYPSVYYGERNRVTGSAKQYYAQPLSVNYYLHGSGWGPGNPNGLPPFGSPSGNAGYQWAAVTGTSPYPGTWDTGLITPLIPLYLSSQVLPMIVDVYCGWAIGSQNEVDSNVVSFTINPAPVLMAAPYLDPSAIMVGQPVSITDQIFSRYYINGGDMTGTWTIQYQLQGSAGWTNIGPNSFTSSYGYSPVYGENGVLYDISYSWTPTASGTYNVRISYSGNRLYSPLTSLSSTLTVGGAVDLGIVPVVQHKDTAMLCLDGCDLQGDHAWDNPHLSVGCNHDSQYCVRACVSMGVSYFGGHLSQDRISYYYMREIRGNTSPEKDLGHNYPIQTLEEIRSILSWALNVPSTGVVYRDSKPTFAEIKGWIDSGRPIVRRFLPGGTGHVTIIDGYEDAGQMVHVIDPGTGSESSVSYETLAVSQVWVSPSTASPRSDEPTVSIDSDNDGIVDFDEINRFHTNPNSQDSDGDLIFDKQEIRSYTFLANGAYDISNARDPNPDWVFLDWNRAELDTDSDNGGTVDGLEDLNRNGVVDVGETDPLNFFDDPLRAAGVRVTAQSPINLLVTDPIGRQVGYDPIIHSVVNEIPYATYSGPGSEPQEIAIPNSINGTYEVDAIGTDTGPYTISVESLDSNSSVIDSDTWEGVAFPDEQYNETLNLDADGSFVLSHDLEMTNVKPLKDVIGEGFSLSLNLTVENSGNCTETVSVTVYANETIIASFTDILLTSKNNVNLSCVWDTTGIAKGNYRIKAVIDVVLGEIDTTDNMLIDGLVFVTLPGDVNADTEVDLFDAILLAGSFNSNPASPNWNPNADINNNDIVDLYDAILLASHYGQH